MAKRSFLAGAMLLASLLVVSCGVPKEDYEAVVAERDSRQAELQSVRSELEAKKSELQSAQDELETLDSELETAKLERQSVQGELDTAKSELQSVKSQLSSAQSTVQAQKKTMAEAKTFAEVISTLFVPALKGETVNEFEMIMQWLNSIRALEDPEAKRLFDAVIDSKGGERELTDFYLYIVETLPKMLE